MEMMGIIGVIVNVALIGQSGQVHRIFPNITANQTIILIVILEVKIFTETFPTTSKAELTASILY